MESPSLTITARPKPASKYEVDQLFGGLADLCDATGAGDALTSPHYLPNSDQLVVLIHFGSMDELEEFTRRQEYIDFRIDLVRYCVRGSTKAMGMPGRRNIWSRSRP